MIDEAPKSRSRNWSHRCSSSAITACHCRTTGRTITNGAAFGTDYFTRTAVAKSNIFVNTPNETKYFYQDLDERRAAERRQPLHGDFRRRASCRR